MTLDAVGIPSRAVDPREIGMLALGSVLESEPVAIDRARVTAFFQQVSVLVVPGFFAYDQERRLHLLGRGGSDLSTVFLASALRAHRCRLLKDVDGVYEHDPASSTSGPARRFTSVSYAQALKTAEQLIQPKAVQLLERHQETAEVAAPGRAYETVVGGGARLPVDPLRATPTRILILGLGTVGGGVSRRLAATPEEFTVVDALVRDRRRHEADDVPATSLHTAHSSLIGERIDVVITGFLVAQCRPGACPAPPAPKQVRGRGADRPYAGTTSTEREDDSAGKGTGGRPEGVYICERDREGYSLRKQSGCVHEDTVPDTVRPFNSAKTTDSGNLDGEDLESQGDGRQHMPSLMNEHEKEIG
jgi:hypothetical protein